MFFVGELCWTLDTREPMPFIPFDLFPCQERALRWLHDLLERGVDGIWEKTRDMGATWLCAAFAVWVWLFRPGSAIGFGSRKLELVDKLGDPKSIFDKIRFIIRHLPRWLLNAKVAGFDHRTHDNHCKILNPANGASITGEGGDNIGRGGRTSMYFIDEAAHLPRPLLVDQALSANSRTKIYLSTPRGGNNTFAIKRLSGKFPVLTLHWREDPRKTAWALVPEDWEGSIVPEGDPLAGELDLGDTVYDYGPVSTLPEVIPSGQRLIYPWYEHLCLTEDEVTVAQEYDIDYTASLQGAVVPAKWLRCCVGLQLTKGQKCAGYDVAGGGSAENVYLDRSGPVVETIERWREDDTTQAAFRVIRLAEANNVRVLYYDSVGVGIAVSGAFRLAARTLKFVWRGLNVGLPPTASMWPDGQRSNEKFLNLKAELYWRLRVRAQRTYEYVKKGVQHPHEDLLSLPPGADTEALIAQLSGIQYFENEAGKIFIETKKQLQTRGVASPDIAEACVLSFAPTSFRMAAGRAGGVKPSADGVKQVAPHVPLPTGYGRGRSG